MEISQVSNYSEVDSESLKLYEFEKRFDQEWYIKLVEKNWTWIFFLSGLYALLVHQGQRWMAKRKPFQIKWTLPWWNFSLAIFSVAVCARMGADIFWHFNHTSFQETLCHFSEQKTLPTLWGAVFTFSKIVEFGDTLFLILTKKPVIFLHWYHHASVAIYAFYAADVSDPSSRWFVLINSFVHMIMYSYYGLRSIGVKIPKPIAASVTSLQISQMIFGVYINVLTFSLKARGLPCERTENRIQFTAVMYASYLILFLKFFYKSYVARPIKKLKPY